jgi:hypothetical protein
MGEVWHPFSPRGLCLKMAICLTMERVASQVKLEQLNIVTQ